MEKLKTVTYDSRSTHHDHSCVKAVGVTDGNGSLGGQTVKAGEVSEENRME